MGEIERAEREFHLGSVAVSGPAEVIDVAARAAGLLSDIIRRQGLAVRIRDREYVKVEGWATAAALLGLMAREAVVTHHPDGTWEAVVEIVRLRDGMVVGRGSAIVGPDEPAWAERPEFARRSMAITRAAGKAFRLALSWIIALAGYEPTPAEEVEALEGVFVEHPTVPQKASVDWNAFWSRLRAAGVTPEQARERAQSLGFRSVKDLVAQRGMEEALSLLMEQADFARS